MYGTVSQLTVVPKMVLIAWRTGAELPQRLTPPTPIRDPAASRCCGGAFCNDGL